MIPFACTQCGMKFQVKEEFAGRQTKCPTCKHAMTVPVHAALPLSAPSRLGACRA
jgi:DNA-directed RNA polymerase subunit RPC12/RpoP